MRQRLDITDVEAQTKIRAKYLRALENEDFAMLPGSTNLRDCVCIIPSRSLSSAA